jgi:hypothetical protein
MGWRRFAFWAEMANAPEMHQVWSKQQLH